MSKVELQGIVLFIELFVFSVGYFICSIKESCNEEKINGMLNGESAIGL